MIRIRLTDGSTLPVTTGRFVELVNDKDGTVNTVFYQQDAHTVIQLIPGSRDAVRYEEMFRKFNLRFNAKMIVREQ